MLDPQQQFLHQKGFGQVVIRPQAQAEQPVCVCIPGRKKQCRDIRLSPQLPEQSKTVAIRQVNIQHHQFRTLLRKGSPGTAAICRRGNVAIPRRPQMFA